MLNSIYQKKISMVKKLSPTIAESLRQAIRTSGSSVYSLAKETSIPQSMLTRFVNGKDIRLETADRLAKFFGLSLKKSN
jgi:plasmid maintenance system antidote protein VapI